jgi:hypothetical protein
MDRVWVTNGSTSVPPVVNGLTAACHDGYLPTEIHLLENPSIEHVTPAITSMMKTVVTATGGEEPDISVETIDEELDFPAIVEYLSSAIESSDRDDAEVAVDVTPGRKFWSIISFRSALEHDVDHIYYSHLKSDDYYGECFPTIPRPAIELVDFTEVS